jgi:CMP-N,N'-diacetyllegionaminic acid synthase
MYLSKTILAIVPARSGSKGVPDKNIKKLGGISLIGRAGSCLNQLSWLDGKIISTDSNLYIKEGKKYNLDAPFLRPESLSGDYSSAVDTVIHGLLEAEKFYKINFDIILIIEPTSPFRESQDVENTLKAMILNDAESSICVSPLNAKYHPLKILQIKSGKLSHQTPLGENIIARQQLDQLYFRNGICYAVSRKYLLKNKSIFSKNTHSYIVDRNIVNIDDSVDFEWAEFLINKNK